MDSIIKTKNLSVIYNLGKSSESTALSGAEIEIFPEEYIVIYGPSGCGKSTLLYCLTGIEVPTTGEVIIQNKNIIKFSPLEMVGFRQKTVGIVFQAYHLVPTLNIFNNVTLPQIFVEALPSERMEKAKNLLQRFGVWELRNRLPSELSGGQQQRVAISRALINNPPIIFADEPVGNLDSRSSKIVMDLLKNLNEKDKKTVILVTHNPQYLYYGHRTLYMKDGEIIREVKNPQKKAIAPPTTIKREKIILPSEIEKLSQRYPFLSEIALKAKLLSQHLLTKYEEEEIGRLENAIESFLLDHIDKKELAGILNLPYEEGGVGLYKQTAQRLVEEIETVLNEAEFLTKKLEERPGVLSSFELKIQSLRKYLLDKYEGGFNKIEELNLLEKFIKMRLENKFDRTQFQKHLDLPLSKGGLGLNRKTAKDWARRLEMVLIKY